MDEQRLVEAIYQLSQAMSEMANALQTLAELASQEAISEEEGD